MTTAATERRPSSASATRTYIPQLIHLVWLHGDLLPEPVLAAAQSWERTHPDWTVVVWDEATLPPLRNQAIFDACTTLGQRTQLARLELLARFGGLCVEAGIESRMALDPLLEDKSGVLIADPQRAICGAVMAFVPGHPFVEALVDAIPSALASEPTGDPVAQLGDEFLTAVVRRFADGPGHMTSALPAVLAPRGFFPSGAEDEELYALLPEAGGPAPDAAAATTRRFVAVLDTDAPAVLAAVLRNYCTLFGPADPVELALCVPGEPREEEGQIVMDLLRLIAPDAATTPEVVLYSFAEAITLPYVGAVTAPGTHLRSGLEASELLAAMTATRAALDTGSPMTPDQPGANLRAGLRARAEQPAAGARRPNRDVRRGRR
jgi:hypothetical protein